MSPSMNGGYQDDPEEEQEDLGYFEVFDGWPEPDPMLACEYWLYKGLQREEAGE